jgi:hypothetical protein
LKLILIYYCLELKLKELKKTLELEKLKQTIKTEIKRKERFELINTYKPTLTKCSAGVQDTSRRSNLKVNNTYT